MDRRQCLAPTHRILPPDEAERIFADCERRNRFIAPIRAVLSRLLGWHFDGTPTARRRAVEQLALVGFRPRSDRETALDDPGRGSMLRS